MKRNFAKMANTVAENFQYGFFECGCGCYIFIDNGSRCKFLDRPAYGIYALLDNEEPENGKVNVYRLVYAEKEPDAETETEKFGLDWYPDAVDIVGTVNVKDLKRV